MVSSARKKKRVPLGSHPPVASPYRYHLCQENFPNFRSVDLVSALYAPEAFITVEEGEKGQSVRDII